MPEAARTMTTPHPTPHARSALALMPKASMVKNQRCQPLWSARKLNAAPVLNTSTRSKKPVIGTSSPRRRFAITICLVTWSSTPTTTARISQGSIRDSALRACGVG